MIEPISLNESRPTPYARYIPMGERLKARGSLPAPERITPGETRTEESAWRKPAPADGAAAAALRECQTCKSRTYQDGSDDPGVSYQTPARINPDSAASTVRVHENEHVTREQAKAGREGREVVSQSVALKTAICPECGRVYVSGGVTTTVTRDKDGNPSFQAGKAGKNSGLFLDKTI